MAITEAELIENLKKENQEFEKLVIEHDDLKKKIKELDKGKFHNTDEDTEIIRLKKLKLKSKDEMHKMLTEYRAKNAELSSTSK